jgi:shikimate dehydrogenase
LAAQPSPNADERSFLLGLIGAPIKHSASPAMHEAAAAALGCRAHYQLIEIENGDGKKLRGLLDGVRDLGFAGVNVTYPYKEAVVPLLDSLSADARTMAAVNTIVVDHGRLVGHNTDVTGFARAAEPLVAKSTGPIAVIGAGGVGKAAAFAMAKVGADEIRIFDRDSRRADALGAMLRGLVRIRLCRDVAEMLDGCRGAVNATPVGMWPNRDSPIPRDLLHSGLWIADAVYSPLWTPLLLAAREAGAEVMTGRTLAINQAVDAFKLFTGLHAPEAAMAAAFDTAIAARPAVTVAA